jgi:predicted RNase H-like HicB family nuclease
MKKKEMEKGMLVSTYGGKFWGEIVDLSMGASVVVLAYSDGHRHYANARKFVPLDYRIEPDEGGFHAFVPSLKGLHTAGETKDEAFKNLKDGIRAYVQSMVKHGEIPARPSILGRKD